MMYIYLRHGDKECGRIILMLSTMALMKVGDGNLDGGHEERDIRHNLAQLFPVPCENGLGK